MWYRTAKAEMDRAVDGRIKSMIRQSPFFKKLFHHYGVDPKSMIRIRFHVRPLSDSYATAVGDDITIDEKLYDEGLENHMHFLAHEMTHWLTDQQERTNYFADPEEKAGFVWGIAHELQRGRDLGEIEDVFLPIITPHFPSPSEARQAFVKMVMKARRLNQS